MLNRMLSVFFEEWSNSEFFHVILSDNILLNIVNHQIITVNITQFQKTEISITYTYRTSENIIKD